MLELRYSTNFSVNIKLKIIGKFELQESAMQKSGWVVSHTQARRMQCYSSTANPAAFLTPY